MIWGSARCCVTDGRFNLEGVNSNLVMAILTVVSMAWGMVLFAWGLSLETN